MYIYNTAYCGRLVNNRNNFLVAYKNIYRCQSRVVKDCDKR